MPCPFCHVQLQVTDQTLLQPAEVSNVPAPTLAQLQHHLPLASNTPVQVQLLGYPGENILAKDDDGYLVSSPPGFTRNPHGLLCTHHNSHGVVCTRHRYGQVSRKQDIV